MGDAESLPGKGAGEGRVKLYADESWLVEYSPRDGRIVVISTDYHAEPLRVDAERWREFGKVFGGGAPAETPGSGGKDSPDLREVLRREGWSIAVSRRTRSARFEAGSRPGEPLVLSRKELYRIAKSTGRRGAARREGRRRASVRA